MPCLPRLGRFLKLYKILLTDFIEVGLQLNYELFRLFNKFFKSLANSDLNGEIIRDIINIFVDFGNTIEVKVNAANLKSMRVLFESHTNAMHEFTTVMRC